MCPIENNDTECEIPDHVKNDIEIDSRNRVKIVGLGLHKYLSNHLCGMTKLFVHLYDDFGIDDCLFSCSCSNSVVADFVKLNGFGDSLHERSLSLDCVKNINFEIISFVPGGEQWHLQVMRVRLYSLHYFEEIDLLNLVDQQGYLTVEWSCGGQDSIDQWGKDIDAFGGCFN